jgi:adenylate cyclase
MINRRVGEVFGGPNSWVTNSLDKVLRTGRIDNTVDSDLVLDGRRAVSVNMTAVPLQDQRDEQLGAMLIMEDITQEKRLRNTMSRYMSKAVMDELLEGGDAVLGGIVK